MKLWNHLNDIKLKNQVNYYKMVLGENFFVFDDVIDTKLQLKLLKYFDDNYKNWNHFKKDISHGDGHNFYDYEFPAWSIDINSKSKVDDGIVEIVKDIEKTVLKKIDMELLSNYRYKLSCYPPLIPYPPQETFLRQIHTDKEIPHLVMVYYVNDVDGDTTLFRNKLGNTPITNNKVERESILGDFTNLEKIVSVSPKQGRVVIFDGILLHTPGWPSEYNRYIINFNTIVKTKNKSII